MRTRFLPVILSVIALLCWHAMKKSLPARWSARNAIRTNLTVQSFMFILPLPKTWMKYPWCFIMKNFEDGSVDWVDTAWVEDGNPYWVYIKVDNEYSVKAEYRFKDKTVYAVDGTTSEGTKHVTDVCDVDCWVIVNNKLDLEIKDEFLEP